MKLQKRRSVRDRLTVVITTKFKWDAGQESDGRVVLRKLILTPKTKS
jgi:hypothetical protein